MKSRTPNDPQCLESDPLRPETRAQAPRVRRYVFATLAMLLASVAPAEQYRLKYSATVEVIEDGKSVGTKRLKAGTILETPAAEEVPNPAAAETKGEKPTSAKRTKSEMPYSLFRTERPKSGTWFRAKVELDDYYNYDFEGKQSKYWSIRLEIEKPNGGFDATPSGYVKRTTPAGKTLGTLLRDGGCHWTMLKLVPVRNPDDDSVLVLDCQPLEDEAE